MTQRKNRWLGIPLIAAALAAVGAFFWLQGTPGDGTTAAPAAEDGPRAESPTEADGGEKVGEGEAQARNRRQPPSEAELRARMLSRMWWNRPKHCESIGLDAELRRRMDERMSLFLDFQRGENSGRESFRAFRRALTDGDFELARERIPPLASANAEPLRRQAEMMVDIMEMLDPEQHRRLVEDHAGLLAGPWVSTRGMGRERRRQ